MVLIKDLYPQLFFDMSKCEEVEDKLIRDWLLFLEKSEYGVSVSQGNSIAIKDKGGNYIVCNNYEILPKEVVEQYKEGCEDTIKEIEEYLHEQNKCEKC